jgi:hypothetical protein
LLLASQAQALPFSVACLSEGSQAPSIECRLASDGLPADRIPLLTTSETGSVFFGSMAGLPPAFESAGGEPEQLLFSLTSHDAKTDVIVSMRNEAIRAEKYETVLGTGSSEALAGHYPGAPSAALFLVGSGIAGVGAVSCRRRGLRRRLFNQAPCTSRKEASSRASVASRFAQWSSHSTPLRI